MMLNWEAIGAVGEIVGAAAVAVTLVFLAVQLRRNTSAIRSSSWQAVQDAEQRFDEFLAGDTKMLDVWARGSSQGVDSLASQAEKDQFFLIVKQMLGLYQTHYYQYERGMIEEEWWATWIEHFRRDVERFPGFRSVLLELYPTFRPSFREFVDAHVEVDDMVG